jgi:uncharacterized protein YbaP (TraB family)
LQGICVGFRKWKDTCAAETPTAFVAGAAHMGGANGVPALLRQRRYRIEQL